MNETKIEEAKTIRTKIDALLEEAHNFNCKGISCLTCPLNYGTFSVHCIGVRDLNGE